MHRPAMEDSHTALLKLDESKADLEANAFFGVFDGHGGTSHLGHARGSHLNGVVWQVRMSQSTRVNIYGSV